MTILKKSEAEQKKTFSLQYNWQIYDYAPLEKVKLGSYRHVCIMSNIGAGMVGHWLRKHSIHYIWLYDYFDLNGLYTFNDCDHEWYDYIPDKSENCFCWNSDEIDPISYEIFEAQRRYASCDNESLKTALLEKLFFLALAERNFILAQDLVNKLRQKIDHGNDIAKAWQEIEKLLHLVRDTLQKRSGKDILMLWVDSVREKEIRPEVMPYLSSLREKSVWFENMFSVTGYTTETLRTIFMGKKLIDDNIVLDWPIISEENSPILADLEKEGYLFKTFGERLEVYMHPSCRGEYRAPQFTPEGGLLWESIRQILLNEQKSCHLIHCMQGSHPPYFSTHMDDVSIENFSSLQNPARNELDQQLAYYIGMFGGNAKFILFSDHGPHDHWRRHQVFLSIVGSDVCPCKVTGLSSNIDFPEIMHHVLHDSRFSSDSWKRSYVEVQGAPKRGGKLEPAYKLNEALHDPGFPLHPYRGIVTDEHVYLWFYDGREWLARRDDPAPPLTWYQREDDICDPSLLPQFRKLARIEERIHAEEMLTESRRQLMAVIEKAMPGNMRRVEVINELFSGLEKCRVALFPGWGESRQLYYMLERTHRKNIAFVIDNDAKCNSASLPVPIVSTKKALTLDFDTVVVTTRQLERWIRPWVENTLLPARPSVQVVYLYKYLEEMGCHLRQNFWEFETIPEDYR